MSFAAIVATCGLILSPVAAGLTLERIGEARSCGASPSRRAVAALVCLAVIFTASATIGIWALAQRS